MRKWSMRNKKIICACASFLLMCTSCKKVEFKDYEKFELTYTEYAMVSGHHYKYLKKEVSKEYGEKIFNLYKSILESNEKSFNQYGAEGFTNAGYYTFDFIYEGKYDTFYVSKENDIVLAFYHSNNRVIYRCYKSLSNKYLNEINEVKIDFNEYLKDVEWTYD